MTWHFLKPDLLFNICGLCHRADDLVLRHVRVICKPLTEVTEYSTCIPGSLELLNESYLVTPQFEPDRKGRAAIEAMWHARVDVRLRLDAVRRQPGREAERFVTEQI